MCVKGDSGGNLAIFAADIVVNPQHPSHIRRLAQVSKWLSLVNVTALGTDIPRQPEGKDLNLIPGRKVFFFLHELLFQLGYTFPVASLLCLHFFLLIIQFLY